MVWIINLQGYPQFSAIFRYCLPRGYSIAHSTFVYQPILKEFEFLIQHTFLHKNTPSKILPQPLNSTSQTNSIEHVVSSMSLWGLLIQCSPTTVCSKYKNKNINEKCLPLRLNSRVQLHWGGFNCTGAKRCWKCNSSSLSDSDRLSFTC